MIQHVVHADVHAAPSLPRNDDRSQHDQEQTYADNRTPLSTAQDGREKVSFGQAPKGSLKNIDRRNVGTNDALTTRRSDHQEQENLIGEPRLGAQTFGEPHLGEQTFGEPRLGRKATGEYRPGVMA